MHVHAGWGTNSVKKKKKQKKKVEEIDPVRK